MPRPKSVEIGGKKVTIQWDAKMGRVGKFPQAGGIDLPKGTITISHGMTTRCEQGTLLHELLHAFWEKSMLHERYSETTEETVIDSLTAWLFDFMRDNPETMEYLQE